MRMLNETVRLLSRRSFARTATGAAMLRALTATDRPERCSELRYRADAHVLLLGISLLHRAGVGGGSVLWRESDDCGATRYLEFNGYSVPARAAGLNRLGFIRETARICEGGHAEWGYFGLMTSSPEENADDAREALHSSAKEQTYSAIDGRIAADETQTIVAHFTAPGAYSGEKRSELEE